ncbi:PstS family phosphate ABC transporter substrate-binding protein [Yoonia sp.]|uniref:PstS family phosphate ABC transporter substrate-binding protein n=1 Tax=Yoonia sp. TaxID=2212373 RepID=UPI002E0BB3AF|nr:substrate-binding domain-containing protein [Yoonia sp.]
MISRFATTLLCTVAPVALFAQSVELRSPDEFINVEGQIVGFNGVMVQVETTVGRVAVPAAEVICYGEACLDVIASNDFGLTEAAFQGVVGDVVPVIAGAVDALSVGFASPSYGTLHRTITGAFAVTNAGDISAELTSVGELLLENQTNGDRAALSVSASDEVADIRVDSVSLNGTASRVYNTPSAWATGTALSHQLLGLKSFSVVVAPNAGITALSVNDLARIFAGEVTNWSQIGGADVSILPLQLPPNSEAGSAFQRLVMEPAGLEVAGSVLTMSDEAGISGSIGQFPGSVGVITTANADQNFVVDVAGSCGIAVAPTPFNVISGDYALIQPIMATYNTTPNTALPTEVFDFAVSDVAQGLVENEGFINFSVVALNNAEKNARISGLLEAALDDVQRAAAAEMFQALFDADRLSSTMTGGPASGAEGAWNRAMLIDLIDFLEQPGNEGREILLVGFGESTNGSAAAIAASEEAATSFAELLGDLAANTIAANNYTVTSYGFGNVSPATCIDGQVTGSEYTRVEVWIR